VSVHDGFERVGTDPFELAVEDRDVVRRFRGRLAMPVTIWTAYDETDSAIGITVASVLVEEGDPPSVLGLVAPDSALWDAIRSSKRFVVHVLDRGQSRMADQFAFRYPGDPFEGVSLEGSAYGPVLTDVKTRAACSLAGYLEGGYSLLIRGAIEEILLDPNPTQPLIHFRGRYLTTGPKT
jgi:3-hydroxy-9,10-secoandrosta-1,3,5(10)-triene-9,17-dione monooxygenase reductase component